MSNQTILVTGGTGFLGKAVLRALVAAGRAGDVRALVPAMAVGDVALAERLASAGRLQAERFSWDETARMTLEVYERVLDAT